MVAAAIIASQAAAEDKPQVPASRLVATLGVAGLACPNKDLEVAAPTDVVAWLVLPSAAVLLVGPRLSSFASAVPAAYRTAYVLVFRLGVHKANTGDRLALPSTLLVLATSVPTWPLAVPLGLRLEVPRQYLRVI